MKSSVLAEPVLVGRERELEELSRCLDSAFNGKGTTVFVSGEAGSGKTRIAREFLNTAKKRGVGLMAGWCLSDAQVPYFPFIEAFNAYFASFPEEEQPSSFQQPKAQLSLGEAAQIRGEEREITAWLTGPRPTEKPEKPEILSPQVWKDQVFAGVAKTLHSITIASTEPMMLFIEDIHWADSASLALLHYVARAIKDSERILLLATFRSEELTADAEGRPHPLAETLRMMRREDTFTEIRLSSLSEASVSKIAENMIGGNLQQELVGKLAAESRGNPLFVVESLRMLHERKSLVQENNEWRLAVDELGIPSKIKDIILRRLACLKYAQRRILDAASVIGEEFDVELLSTVLGQDSLDVLETLNVIAHSTSLVCVEENFYRFDHARSREILYEELSPPLKRGYHNRIAEKLESTKSTLLPLSDLAYHYAQAFNKQKALKYSLSAGQDALARFSNTEAIKHFKYVLDAVGQDPKRTEERTSALEGLGDAFYASNKFKEAIKTFETLANTDIGAVKMRALTKAMFAAFFQGDIAHIAELVRRAEEYGDMSRLDRAHILHFKTLNFDIGGKDEGYKLIEESLRIFEEEYALSDAAGILFVAAAGPAKKGEMKKALAMGLRSIAIYEDLGDFRSQMDPLNQVAGGNFSSYGLYPEALGMLEKVFEIEHKTKMGNYIMLAESCMYSAQIVGLMGDFAGAVAKSLRALEYQEKAGSHLWSLPVYSNLLVNYVKLGDLSHAEEYLDKLLSLQPAINNPFYAFYSGLAKAVYYAGKNQWEQSTKHFNETAATALAHSPYSTSKISFQANYAWALEKQGRSAEANKILQGINKVVEEYAEKVKHANIQLGLMAPINVIAGQTFEARLDIVNVSRANCTITNIQNLLPSELKVIAIPTTCTAHEGVLKLKDKTPGPFSVKTLTISLQASKAGMCNLNPQVTYVDDLGQTKTSTTKAITITAKPEQPTFTALTGRITTGYKELDRLLLGGIPENYAVVVTSPSTDEREQLIRSFLEAGATAGETTFHITTEAANTKRLATKHLSNFYLFLCNPQADAMIQNAPNVFKLKGVENLTDIDIALTKAFRILTPSATGPRRVCIEIVSDVLLQHHAVITRRWLSALLPTLKSKGFTILAIVDPQMHPPEELQAILGVFDGEIRAIEKETPEGIKQMLRVRRLFNQKYLENEIVLTREKLFG